MYIKKHDENDLMMSSSPWYSEVYAKNSNAYAPTAHERQARSRDLGAEECLGFLTTFLATAPFGTAQVWDITGGVVLNFQWGKR